MTGVLFETPVVIDDAKKHIEAAVPTESGSFPADAEA